MLETVAAQQHAIACALGGKDGRTLYGLTAPDTHPDRTRAAKDARIYTHRAPSPAAAPPS